MSEHTSLPWRIADWSAEESVIVAEGDSGKDKHVTMTAINADANFIVHAVNSHYALVEALKAIIDAPMIDHQNPDRSAYGIARSALAALASKDTPTHG